MTIQKVVFVPRAMAERMQPPANSVLISIYDKSEPPMTPDGAWRDLLRLRFHDTDGSLGGLEVVADHHAEEALAFVRRHLDADLLVVHCQAGQSRSAGAALFFAERLGVPCFKVNAPVKAENYPFYNRKVYRTLYDVWAQTPCPSETSGL